MIVAFQRPGNCSAALIGLVLAFGFTADVCRGQEPAPEYAVKAAFIYNFTQFITWPADAFTSADAPFIVAIVGNDPFKGAMDRAMEGKSAGGRPITVKHFASADQIGPCHLLFVPAEMDDSLSQIMDKTHNHPVLTVGESDRFSPAGGGMRFYIEDGKVRFEIDPDVIDAARLKVSAKLMKLARIWKR